MLVRETFYSSEFAAGRSHVPWETPPRHQRKRETETH